MKNFSVIGAGVSGSALAFLAADLGAKVFVSEEKESGVPAPLAERFRAAGIEWEAGGHTERAFRGADAVLLSAGVPPSAACVAEAERRGIPVVGEIDFAAPHIRGPVIGVTGSNGKSTVTSLCGHILRKAGLKAAVGGNLGEAASLFTKEDFDCVVLELSSFQLARTSRLRCRVGVVTNLAPDHIDWHGSYEAYAAAKARLLSLVDPSGWGVAQQCDALALNASPTKTALLEWENAGQKERDASVGKSAGKIAMGEDAAHLVVNGDSRLLFRYRDTSLIGRHNLENVAMAFAAVRLFGVDAGGEDAAQFLDGFRPLPHRCELVGEVDGVRYIDDSKGTNVAASATAMGSIDGRKVVILGGKGKGEDYAPLAEAVKRHADAAVLLGAEREKIEAALRSAGFSNIRSAPNMEEAVEAARSLARPGMVVLLSPACTSWDMYESYKKRGEHFNAVVRGFFPGPRPDAH
ncbi:MAG: UDP-N-acetylmuramoyl-L-alanine--D-glutamate ligase [Synergistaceae bacterium]|jgi:UDP-N-acetylmuramoylalanine--D-glutamate ligase|nr:UDP-N-acetylmuramoyl-L-alanine--D-glutamate ligase [Synergistaceae bacterium]